MNDKPLLAEIDDDNEIGYLDRLRARHFRFSNKLTVVSE